MAKVNFGQVLVTILPGAEREAEHGPRKWRAEVAMYFLFCLAALPLVWVTFDLLTYYASYPDGLRERETFQDALAVFAVLPLTLIVLIPAALFALYLLIFGRNPARAAIVALAGTYVALFGVRPGFPVNTIASLAWDAATASLMAFTPILVLVIRHWQKKKVLRLNANAHNA
jgi:hypothetical protein